MNAGNSVVEYCPVKASVAGSNPALRAMNYLFYLKSRTEAPDFEVEIEANSKEEAMKSLLKKYPYLEELGDALLSKSLGEI